VSRPPTLRDLPLTAAAVTRDATFGDAVRALFECGSSAIAVVDEHDAVVGVFTEDDLLAGLFPAYLSELHHTAFAPDDFAALKSRAQEALEEPVDHHVSRPVTVDADTSLLHVAEIFLHSEPAAVAVVEEGRFLGMLAQVVLCRRLLLTWSSDGH
jgi:CBS domain-containing protein